VPLVRVTSNNIPRDFGYMTVEAVVFKVGEEIRSDARILLINTEIGRYWIVSHLEGVVSEPIPSIGDNLVIEDAGFLYVEVAAGELTNKECSFSDAPGPIEFLQEMADEEREKLTKLWYFQKKLENLEAEHSVDGVQSEQTTETQNAGDYFKQIVLMAVLGGIAGLLTYKFIGNASTPIWLFGAFMLGMFFTLWSKSSLSSSVGAALVFTATFFVMPQLPQFTEFLKAPVSERERAIVLETEKKNKAEKSAELAGATARKEKILSWDAELMSVVKANNVIVTKNDRWDKNAKNRDYFVLIFDVVNNSNGLLGSLEVDPFEVDKWRKVTFNPPLKPMETISKSIRIPRAKDGKPVETLGQPEERRWHRLYNRHRNPALKRFNRTEEFTREARSWIFAK